MPVKDGLEWRIWQMEDPEDEAKMKAIFEREARKVTAEYIECLSERLAPYIILQDDQEKGR